MKVLTAAFRTTPPAITVVGIGSLVILLAKILWLNYLPELFSRADVVGDLMENILAATVAAYVFFVISYQVPQVIERRRIGLSIVRLAYSVVNEIYSIYVTMHFPPPPEIKLNEVTLETVRERFRAVSPSEPSRLFETITSKRLTWLQALVAYKKRYCGHIDKIWRYSRFIDPELAALLDELEFSGFAHDMEMMKDLAEAKDVSMGLTNPTLAVWADEYFKCYEGARALAKYCDGYVKLYGLK